MLKRFLTLIVLVLFLSSFIYGVNCYSNASLKNEISTNIVDSKDALIAIPSSLTLKDSTIVTEIKNNTNEKIWLNIEQGTMVSREINADSTVNQEFGVPVESGEKISVTINLDNWDIVNEIIFHARWHENYYAAEIRSSINKE